MSKNSTIIGSTNNSSGNSLTPHEINEILREGQINRSKLEGEQRKELDRRFLDAVKNGDGDWLVPIVKLIKQGADLEASYSYYTPLGIAASSGHIEIVKFLLELGASINVLYYVPLIAAAERGHIEIVKALLEKGAGTEIRDSAGRMALAKAAGGGHIEIVKLLLVKGANIEGGDFGFTALIAAVCHGQIEVVKFLLEQGANIESSYDGLAPLATAAEGNHIEIFKLLLEKGAKIEGEKPGFSALIKAAENGHIEVVKFLIEKGANTEAKNNEGKMALVVAAYRGHIEVVKFLLKQEDDTEVKNNAVKSALIDAARGGHIEVVKFLLEQGNIIKVESRECEIALIAAAKSGRTEIVKFLLKQGVDIEAKTNSGFTALLAAAGFFLNTETVKFLLEQGANIEARSGLGNTALGQAFLGSWSEDILNLIITSVASSNQHQIPNELGKTVWDRTQNEICQLIQNSSGQRGRSRSFLDCLDQETIIFLAIILPEGNNLKTALAPKISALNQEDQTKITELTALRADNLEYFTKQNKAQSLALASVNKRTYQILRINSNQPLGDWQQDKVILKLRDLRGSLIEKTTPNINRAIQKQVERGEETKASTETITAEADKAANEVIITLLKCDNLKEISHFFTVYKEESQLVTHRKTESDGDKKVIVSGDSLGHILGYFVNGDPIAIEVIKKFFKEQNQAAAAEGKKKAEQPRQEGEDVIATTKNTAELATEAAAEIEKKDPNPNSKTSSASRLGNVAASNNQVSDGCCVFS
jgi:ankyrin repeat protein